MARFLSPAWLDEMASVAAGLSVEPVHADPLVLRTAVLAGPDGDLHYDLQLTTSAVDVIVGGDDAADVTITQDYDTAVRLVRGDAHPEVELTNGTLRISGQANRLTAWSARLDAFDEALSELRSNTTWD